MEYEYSINVKLDRLLYDRMLASWNVLRTEFVSYFPDFRCSNENVQRKKCLKKTSLLRYERGKFIPFNFKISTEEDIREPINFGLLESIVERKIIQEENDAVIKHRLSFDEVVSSTGCSLSFNYDAEYVITTEEEFQREQTPRWKILKSIFDRLYGILETYWCEIEFDQNSIETKQLANIPSRVFGKFKDLKGLVRNQFVMKVKFDGYKGKICNNVYKDDLNNIGDVVLPPILKAYSNLILQYEMMSETRTVILTDVIGIYRHNILYSPTPLEVLAFFRDLQIRDDDRIRLSGEEYKLLAQRPFTSDMVVRDKHDGYIIIHNGVEYKYKEPTCEVRIKGTDMYLDCDGTMPLDAFVSVYKDETTNLKYENNSVYEIKLGPNDRKIILRKREDRPCTSTREEYDNFIADSHYLEELKCIYFGSCSSR